MLISGKQYRSIWVDQKSEKIKLIDQRKLPHNVEIITLKNLQEAVKAISEMYVRGAPLIGVTAAFGFSLAMKQDTSEKSINNAYEQLINEAKGGTAVFTFGRFNPPTIGHEKLLKVVANAASKQRGDYYVFMSQSHDPKKNPLKHDQKQLFMKLIFPKHRKAFIKSKARRVAHHSSRWQNHQNQS